MKYCMQCDFVGEPKRYNPGSFRMEIVAWLFFLIPGAVYVVGDVTGRYPGIFYSISGLLERLRPESIELEVVVWLLFLLPGAMYSLWRLQAAYKGCANCASKRIVKLDSEEGQAALRRLSPTAGARSWVCMSCGKPIFTGGRFCPNCEASQARSFK